MGTGVVASGAQATNVCTDSEKNSLDCGVEVGSTALSVASKFGADRVVGSAFKAQHLSTFNKFTAVAKWDAWVTSDYWGPLVADGIKMKARGC